MTCGQKGKWPGVPLSRPSVAGQPKPALLSDLQGYCARSQDRTRHMACSFRIPIRAIIPVAAPVSQLGGGDAHRACRKSAARSEEHTSELQSLMRISYAVFCLNKKKNSSKQTIPHTIDRQSKQTQQKNTNK